MATNKYGIDTRQWAMLPPEDQNQIVTEWNQAHGVAYTPPAIGGYAPGAVTNPAQQAQVSNAAAPPQGGGSPQWVFAVNLPSTYPDYAAMKANNAGLVVVADDPNAQLLIDGARAHGIPVAIQVNAPNGISPEEYAARVAEAKSKWNPDRLVLDIEGPGKGYEGSAGWNWSAQAAPLIAQAAGGTPSAVTMEPNQDDYNYAAYTTALGSTTQFWPQSYFGDMTQVDPDKVVQTLVDNGVNAANIIPVLAPGQKAGTRGLYASYGVPTGPAGGIYAPGATNNVPYYPGQAPVAGAGSGATPGPPVFVNPGGTYGGGQNTPPPTTTPVNWAQTYFGDLGLPANVQTQINGLFAQYPDDPQLAIQLAKQLVRGTPWFAQTFPGFFEGIRAGLFSDETGYRGYVNAANVFTMQYFNRPITTTEIESALHQGLSPEIIGRTYEASAISQAQGPEIQYQLGAFGDQGTQTPQQLGQSVTDVSRQQAGLGSVVGAKAQAALDRATKRMQTLFQGQLAVPNTAGQALSPPPNRDLPA